MNTTLAPYYRTPSEDGPAQPLTTLPSHLRLFEVVVQKKGHSHITFPAIAARNHPHAARIAREKVGHKDILYLEIHVLGFGSIVNPEDITTEDKPTVSPSQSNKTLGHPTTLL